MIGLIASIGLVVAIFVSNVAFAEYEELQGDAKLGAIISSFPCPIIAWVLCKFFKFDDADDAIRSAAETELINATRSGKTIDEVLVRNSPAMVPEPDAEAPPSIHVDMATTNNATSVSWGLSCDGVRSRGCGGSETTVNGPVATPLQMEPLNNQ